MITILGTGLAGYTLAREIRKLDKTQPLCLITQDDGAFYSKPALSNALTLKRTPDQLVTASVEKMQTDLNATIFTFQTVKKIDPATKTLFLSDTKTGEEKTQTYTKLVFAVGAQPNPIAFPEVLQVNSLTDYRVWDTQLKQSHVKRVAILGGGLIGCEFANDLAQAGYQTTIVDSGATPLGRMLPERAGHFFKNQLEAAGIHFVSQARAQQVEKKTHCYHLTLNTGHVIETDLILAAIGLKTNTDLAQAAGCAIHRGIQTNAYLETTLPDHYALGDCAEVEGFVLPYVMPIMQGARALAQTLTGNPTAVAYPNMPVLVKTTACPTVIALPRPNGSGEWSWEETETTLKGFLYNPQKELEGFILMGAGLNAEKQKLSALLPKWL